MRLNIFYLCIALILFSCSNGVNNISEKTSELPETDKKQSGETTKNTSSANTSRTTNQNSSGKECDEKKPCGLNSRVMLW